MPEQEKANKYPVFKAFSNPVIMLIDHLKAFGILGGISALALLIVSFVFAQSFVCLVPDLRPQSYCGADILTYIFYILVKFFIISSFLRMWADVVFLKKSLNFAYFKQNISRYFKFFGIFLAFLLINSLPAVSLYFIIKRVPNPVWQIEILYFLFMSLGFIIPFVLLRFYTNLALFISDKPCLNIKQVYEKTNFKSSKIFLAFSLVLAFCLFFFLTINTNLKAHIFTPIGLYNILAEYIFECALLVVATLMFNFIMVQKEIFE